MSEALPKNPSLGSNKASEIIVNVIGTKWHFYLDYALELR